MWFWHELTPHTYWPSRWWGPAAVAGLMVGYAYCYGLTAVLVRRLLRDTTLRPTYAWLTALILFGFGCIGPYLARFVFYPRRYGYGYPDELIALYLPNPVVMIEDAMSFTNPHVELTIVFLVVWGVLVTLLNVSWLARQVHDFRPPDKAKAAPEKKNDLAWKGTSEDDAEPRP
jgi:hypothetical protein